MNIHGIRSERKTISFFTFKGHNRASTLDQITLPPVMGVRNMRHEFGEWLKREGHDWESLSEEALCRLSVDYFNKYPQPGEPARRFDRMAATNGSEAT